VRINALHFLEEAKIVAELLGNFDERAQVFGKATAAEAQAGVEETASNAHVHAHAVGHFLHVGAAGFANHGDRVDVGNLERQKRIGGVLDQFGGVDVRDNNGRVERFVNALHGRHRALRTNTNDHSVR